MMMMMMLQVGRVLVNVLYNAHIIIMVALCNRADHYIFIFFLLFILV